MLWVVTLFFVFLLFFDVCGDLGGSELSVWVFAILGGGYFFCSF